MNVRSLHLALLLSLVLLFAACGTSEEQASEQPLEPEHESEAPGVDEEPIVEQEEEPAAGPEPHSYEVQRVEEGSNEMTDLSNIEVTAYLHGQVNPDTAAQEIQEEHSEYDIVTAVFHSAPIVEQSGEGLESMAGSYQMFANDEVEAQFLDDLDTYLNELPEPGSGSAEENTSLAVGEAADLAGGYEGVQLAVEEAFVAANVEHSSAAADAQIVIVRLSVTNETGREIDGAVTTGAFTENGESLTSLALSEQRDAPREYESFPSYLRPGSALSGTIAIEALPSDALILEYAPMDVQADGGGPLASWEIGPVSDLPESSFPAR